MSWPVRCSVRMYRLLLAVFPRPFRRRFGGEIAETFTRLAEDAFGRHGWRGLGRLWLRTFADLGRQGGEERLGNGYGMDRKGAAGNGVRRDRDGAGGNGVRRDRDGAEGHGGRRAGWVDGIRQDLAFAFRSVRRGPAFAAAVIATVALGIGANTAIFTVVNGILLRPLPFAGSERVVQICETHERVTDYCVVSPPNLQDWARMSAAFETLGLARNWVFSWQRPEGARNLRTGVATPGWFPVHDIEPALGRLFGDADMDEGNNRVAVLSHTTWVNELGGRDDVLGDTMVLDGEPFTVIGVLPPDPWMYELDFAQIWLPLSAIQDDVSNRDWRGFTGIGKLAPGATLAGAREEMEGIRAALAGEHPDTNRGWGLRIELLRDRVAGQVRNTLLLFLGAVGLVLLIACANVANLLLVRSTARAQEFAVRASMGAGRARLARQLVTESFVLAALGGIAGVLLALATTRMFLRLAPPGIPRLDEVGVDGAVLLFALLATLLTALLFGVAPALAVARGELAESLRARRSLERGGNRLRRGLVVAEMALAVLLLVGAGLLARGFTKLASWNPGFNVDNLVTAFAFAPTDKYPTGAQAVDLFERAAAELRALPQVAAVGLTSAGPLFGGIETAPIDIAARPAATPDERPTARYFDVGTEYFATMGIAVLRGRDFTPADGADAAMVMMVNEAFAQRFFPGEDALDQEVELFDRPWRIVGVVADIPPLQPGAAVEAEIYVPKRQYPRWGTYLVVRTRGDASGLADAARARLRAVDPDLDAAGFVALTEITGRYLVSPRFNVLLIGLFSSVALLLAAIGTYGVIAFAVTRRTHEIGIRMALGARPGNVRLAVIGSGMALASVGLVAGIAGALALARLLGGMTYGVAPSDPLTLLCVSALFGGVALLACWLPARRASRLDPLEALRAE